MGRGWTHVLAALVAVTFTPGPARATTRRVPQDYASIQAAINAAQEGDLVLLAPGTYLERITLDGTNIVLASEFYTTGDRTRLAQTVIDGTGGDVLTVRDTIGEATQIVGLTIRGGDDGVIVWGRPVIRDCRVTANTDGLEYRGGGGVVRDCVVEENLDDGLDSNRDLDILVERTVFRHNSNDGLEIRVPARSGPTLTVVVRDNRIYGNDGDGIQIISEVGVAVPTNRTYVFEHNLVAFNGDSGLGFLDNGESDEDFRAASFRDRVHLFGNVFAGHSHGVSGGDDLIALNNLFVDCSVAALKGVDGDSIASFNGFWGNGTDALSSNVDLATSLRADPRLDAEWRLLPGSPAIDAGTARFVRGTETVLDLGMGEYLGPAPDLGRTEFVSGRGAVQEIRIAGSADDAEESASRFVALGEDGLELAQTASGGQTVGLRFEGLDIPHGGGTVSRAYLQFRARFERSAPASLTVTGEASDQASTFTTADGNLSSRPRTGASVAWAPPSWQAEVEEAEEEQRTPDLSGVLQEIVDRPGWASGGPAAFFVTGSGDRLAEAYDARPASAPLLHLELACPADADADGVCDPGDACPAVADPGQGDLDRDLRGDACDCAPSDPGSFAPPAEVASVVVEGAASTAVSWAAQADATGPGVVYDLAGGMLSALRGPQGYASAACLAAALVEPSWADPQPAPAPGDGRYYLPRARNACSAGTYGPPGLDAWAPCP